MLMAITCKRKEQAGIADSAGLRALEAAEKGWVTQKMIWKKGKSSGSFPL